MKVSNQWAVRDSQDLETIKQEHLLRHFHQIAIITCKHYHYAFQIIKHLHQLQPNKNQKITTFIRITQQIATRKKMFAFNTIKRKIQDVQYEHSKASLIIATFLERKIIGTQVNSFFYIKKYAETKAIKKLFLVIAFSNLNKLIYYTKKDVFLCLKKEHFIRTQEIRKAKLVTIGMVLNNYITRLKIDGFLSITHPHAKFQPSDDQEDAQAIFVQSYKTMACNLNRPQNRAKSLQLIKRQTAIKDISNIIVLRQKYLLQSCLTDLLCHQNHRFTPSTLAVLRREIAILQQEYESV